MIGACQQGPTTATTMDEILSDLPAEEPLDGPWAPPHRENGVGRRINSVVGRGPDVECSVIEVATFSTGFTVLLELAWRPSESTRHEVAGLLRQSPLSRPRLPFADWWVRVEVEPGDSEMQTLQPSYDVEPFEGDEGDDEGDDEGLDVAGRTLLHSQSVHTSTMRHVGEISVRWLLWVSRLTSAVVITSGWEAGGLPPSRLQLSLDET